jgi:Domain of unknown function (DUF4405)
LFKEPAVITEHRRDVQSQISAEHRRNASTKARIRALIALALIVLWGIAALTGLLLYVAPHGPRSGQLVLLLLTRAQWGDLHFWSSIAASVVTVIHIAIDWKALKACVRFLVSTERG